MATVLYFAHAEKMITGALYMKAYKYSMRIYKYCMRFRVPAVDQSDCMMMSSATCKSSYSTHNFLSPQAGQNPILCYHTTI